MRTIDQLLDTYGESHQNRTNKIVHWVCVPVIVWTVVALLWSIPFPAFGKTLPVWVNWATAVLALAQLYYFKLSIRLGIGLLLYNLLMVWIAMQVDQLAAWPLWVIAVVLFVLAWIGQFIGHLVEGKRPSFLQDLQFLLIGPAWLMAFIYRAVGLRY